MLIVYAEDDVDDYHLFAEILASIAPDATLMNARDGRDVIDLLESMTTLPDVIVLDINMPSMDGKACLKSIKRDARWKEIPVIIYTTAAQDRDRQQCLQMGAAKYLVKPHTLAKVEPLIRDALQPFLDNDAGGERDARL